MFHFAGAFVRSQRHLDLLPKLGVLPAGVVPRGCEVDDSSNPLKKTAGGFRLGFPKRCEGRHDLRLADLAHGHSAEFRKRILRERVDPLRSVLGVLPLARARFVVLAGAVRKGLLASAFRSSMRGDRLVLIVSLVDGVDTVGQQLPGALGTFPRLGQAKRVQ
ncbi:hypothetical protein D3C86_1442230 [compost metagenome]